MTLQALPDDSSGAGSVVDLVKKLLNESTALFRQELALMKAETFHSVTSAKSALGWLVIGGAVALFGVSILLLSAVLALALILPGWAAALVIGATVLIIGGVMLAVGKKQLNLRNLALPRTRATWRGFSVGRLHD
jgi:Putative Actinobacterial Holin-X, holin superfamily III